MYKALEIDFEIPEILQEDIDDFLKNLNEEDGNMADCYEMEIRNILNGCDTTLTEGQILLLRNYYCLGGIYKSNVEKKSDRRGTMKTLKYWYITEAGKRYKGAVIAHGIVRGHERLSDGTKIYTSQIESVATNGSEGEVIINTRNSEYHCRLETALYCRFDEAGRDMLPNFERLREEYELQLIVPGTGNGALIVLDDEAEYQFVGAAFRIGERDGGLDTYIRNAGSRELIVRIAGKEVRIAPGETQNIAAGDRQLNQ